MAKTAAHSVDTVSRAQNQEAGEPPPRANSRSLGEEGPERAYEPVALRELWGVVSLVLFALSLGTRLVARVLPDDIPGWGQLPPDPIVAVLSVPLLSIMGLGSALLSDRTRSATGRIGFLLNLVVFGLSVLLVLLVMAWRLSR